jgi:hypothetical protein
MDLNEYWQENKRFIVSVASGVIVFVTGSMLVNSFFRDDLMQQRKSATSTESKLKNEPMYSSNDFTTAEKENRELKQAVDVLSKAVEFEPREMFRLDPQKGSANNQYFTTVSGVREKLLMDCGRGNLRIQEDLGLPALSPTHEPEIARYLAALDLVDRAVHVALSAGIERIDKIQIQLDPKLASKQGVGDVERTRVVLGISGHTNPMVQFLLQSQNPKDFPPLLIEKADIQPARGKANEAKLDLTLVLAELRTKQG